MISKMFEKEDLFIKSINMNDYNIKKLIINYNNEYYKYIARYYNECPGMWTLEIKNNYILDIINYIHKNKNENNVNIDYKNYAICYSVITESVYDMGANWNSLGFYDMFEIPPPERFLDAFIVDGEIIILFVVFDDEIIFTKKTVRDLIMENIIIVDEYNKYLPHHI